MEKELVLCDTNIFINWFNQHEPTIGKLQEIGLENIAVSVITIMELIEGVDNKQQLQQLKKKISNYYIVDFNENISKLSLQYIESYNLSHSINIPDAIIGASAVEFGLKLFTYNTKDFKFLPGINLYE